MECPLCAKLREEYGSEAEQEARATLQQRAACFHGFRSDDHARYDLLQNLVQTSRQRQAKLTELRDRHMVSDHSMA
jgi:hypothetical protein